MWSAMVFIMGLAWVAGLAIGALFIPLMIYTLPYGVWLEDQKSKNKLPKKLESEEWLDSADFESGAYHGIKFFLHNTVNATKLYRSWITGKPHGIKKF